MKWVVPTIVATVVILLLVGSMRTLSPRAAVATPMPHCSVWLSPEP